jgi:hypothetical protein
VWRFRNTGENTVDVNVAIDNVLPGKQAVLVMSNGTSKKTELPGFGGPGRPLAPTATLRDMDGDPQMRQMFRNQWNMSVRNRETALRLRDMLRASPQGSRAGASAAPAPVPSVVVGVTTKDWRDTGSDDLTKTPKVYGLTYKTTARATCALTSGRKAVFWVEDDAWLGGTVKQADLDVFTAMFCASGKGFDKVTSLRGDPWGTNLRPDGYLQETKEAPLDLNIVYLNFGPDAWSGYFHDINSTPRTVKSFERSNEALVFFINASYVPKRRDFIVSIHLHELTHLVNYYSRGVLLGNPYEPWLDEMSAMMTEDMVVPTVTSPKVHVVPGSYVKDYVSTGGGTNLIKWGDGGKNSYAVNGSFGAFLNRRFGSDVYTGMGECEEGPSDYDCLAGVISKKEGRSLEDEFARFGASVFGLIPATQILDGYGFPQKTVASLDDLPAIDVGAYATDRKETATPLDAPFPETTHTYDLTTIPAGQTSYANLGVKVPPHTYLMLIIQ